MRSIEQDLQLAIDHLWEAHKNTVLAFNKVLQEGDNIEPETVERLNSCTGNQQEEKIELELLQQEIRDQLHQAHQKPDNPPLWPNQSAKMPPPFRWFYVEPIRQYLHRVGWTTTKALAGKFHMTTEMVERALAELQPELELTIRNGIIHTTNK